MNNPALVENSTAREHALIRGRELLRQHAWIAAFAELSAVDRQSPLEAEDMEALARAAHLIGRDAESAELLARAHQAFLARGEICKAARCAISLGFTSLIAGE